MRANQSRGGGTLRRCWRRAPNLMHRSRQRRCRSGSMRTWCLNGGASGGTGEASLRIEDLRRVDHRHELEDTNCPIHGCGRPMVCAGEDIGEELDIVPAQYLCTAKSPVVVGMHLLRGQHVAPERCYQWVEQVLDLLDPPSNRGAGNLHALARVDSPFAVQRQMLAILAQHHVREQARARDTAAVRPHRCCSPEDRLAFRPGHPRPHGANHLEARRHVLQLPRKRSCRTPRHLRSHQMLR